VTTPDESSQHPFVQILRGFGHDHERCRMEVDAIWNEIAEFLDSLDAKQLTVLRKILGAPKLVDFFDGMAYTLLRRIHGVDPDTGKSPEEALAEQTGGPR
jgi:hypothetical protein